MAVGFPAKTNFATGEVLTATNMNDITGTLNLLNPAAKGVLFAASAANTPAAVTVGADGTVLTADAASAQGVKWASVAGGSTFVGAQATSNAATFSYVSGTAVVMTFPTENFDTNTFHSTSVNTSRMTIPTGKGGYYLLSVAGIYLGSAYPSYAWLGFLKNGTSIGAPIAYNSVVTGNNGNANTSLAGNLILSLAAGDYVESAITTDLSTGVKNLTGSFSIAYLGA